MKKALVITFLIAYSLIYAQDDAAGCKDHVSFPRMASTSISECISVFEKTPVQLGDDIKEIKLGLKSDIDYAYNGAEASAPSFADIVKYYENIIQIFSGRKIYSGNDHVTFKGQSASKTLWLQIKDMSNFANGNYGLVLLECDVEKLPATSKEMGDMLLANGRIMLSTSFEPAKSELKPDMQKSLNQLVRALKDHPLVKFTVEAHPDKNLSGEMALKLAEHRAKTVYTYLNSKGIGKFRMNFKGVAGSLDNPLTGNSGIEIIRSDN